MAETYKNILTVLPATLTTVYTCPVGRSAIILGLQCANVSGTAQQAVTAQVLDSSNGNAARRFAFAVPVPTNGAVDPCVGKIFLEAGDAVQMMAGNANMVEVVGAVLEIS
jgi:hypothetical protein